MLALMADDQWSVVLDTEPDPSLREVILSHLREHIDSVVGPGQRAVLSITVKDSAGNLAGGLWGRVGNGFLFVELLALGPARGQGLGRKVMETAEADARRRGLLGMWVDTFTFQAPGFYEKLGFTEFGRITGYPPGHDRVFYLKRFTAPAA